MSRLILVRHAQASFFADNYDQLSPLGESSGPRTGGTLGEARHRLRRSDRRPARNGRSEPSRLFAPSTTRTESPGPRPKSAPNSTNTAWTSFWDNRSRSFCDTTPHSSRWPPTIATPRFRNRSSGAFSACSKRICHLWCTAAPGTESIESWNSFQARVESGLRRVFEHPGRNRTIVVFTSVGNITVALASCWVARRPRHSSSVGG